MRYSAVVLIALVSPVLIGLAEDCTGKKIVSGGKANCGALETCPQAPPGCLGEFLDPTFPQLDRNVCEDGLRNHNCVADLTTEDCGDRFACELENGLCVKGTKNGNLTFKQAGIPAGDCNVPQPPVGSM